MNLINQVPIVLRVNLSPVEKKNCADDKLSEEIAFIGNSLIKDGRDGMTKIFSVSGAGIQEVEKKLQGMLPENVIVHIGANDIAGHMNRSEELMNKIKKVLNDLKEKKRCVFISGIVPRPRRGGRWHNMAFSVDMRVKTL